MSPPKSTPKSKRNEKSRRSSILKPRKPRQPFQNVNFDSPTKPLNETNSTPLKTKRRVSFAEKKHVKEFCHSVEQGTVWDNTYEEHDCSLKSSISDSSGKTESTEGASLHISQKKCEHICESNLNNPNNFNLTNNQLSESIVSVQEKDNENCEMTFTNSFKYVEFDEECTQTTLLTKSALFQACKNATLHGIFKCNNTDENHRDPADERFQLEQNLMLSPLSVSHKSENAISSNIIYRDPDEENNSRRKSYSESRSNVATELDSTCNQDLSMEITAPVPTFLLPSRAAEQINVQKDDNTNYIDNCKNASIQAASMKPVSSDLGIFKQIAEIQNCKNENLSVENNTRDKMIFSTNLQSNITSESVVFKQTEDATQNIDESMILTTAINVQRDANTSYTGNYNNGSTQATSMKPVNSNLGIFKQIGEIQNHGNEHMSVENYNTHDKTIFSTNLQSNIVSENAVFRQTEDATQNIDESMILTTAINMQRDDNTSYTGNCNNASIQAASMKPVSSDLGIFKQIGEIQNRGNENMSVENNTHNKIFSTNLQSNVTSENTVFRQTEDATQNIDESMILTTAINMQRDDNASYTGNCNNASIQAASMKPVSSDLGIFKQIGEIQNRRNENLCIENYNTHDKMIFSTNLQSNIASENAVFRQTEDATQNIDESMILTTAINVQRDDNTSYTDNYNKASTQATSMKPVNCNLGIFKQIGEIQNCGNENMSVENNTHDKIFSTNLQPNVISENTVFRQTEDATQNIDESMILTTAINVQRDDNTSYTGNCNNASIQAAFIKPASSDLGIFKQIAEIQNCKNENLSVENNTRDKMIFSTNLQSNITSESVVFKQTEDATQNIAESMILTTAINVQRDDNTSYTDNYNKASTQATSMKSVNSDLGILKQIAEMQNCGNENLSVGNNMHSKTIFSTNLQSNIASEHTLFKQTEDTTRNITESMTLTTVIQPFTTNNTVFNTSIEMTAAVPSKMYNKIISHSHDENMIEKNNLREDRTDETEFFTDVMMEMTKPVNVLPPLIVSNKKKDLRMDDEVKPNDDRTMLFQDISMEITNVISKNQEITRPNVHKSISEESAYKEKNMDNSSNFNEKTRLLCKSMEFTEAVPVSLHHERTFNAICTAQSTSISETTSKLDLPVENLVSESTLQDTVANKTIQHVEPMEITATDLSTLHLRDATDERESSIISKDNEFQHLTTDNCRLNDLTANNLSESRKNVTKESYIISKEISVLPSSTNNLNHSSSTVLKNSSRREAFEDEQPNLKKFCSLFTESRLSQENNVHLSLRSNNSHVNDTGCNEYSIKDHTMDCSELSGSNFKNNLEISECNLFRKSLENNIIELSSIKPPSFLSLDSDKEENSFLDALHEDKPSTDDDGTVNNMCNNSNQLIGNNVTEYLAESRTIVNKSNYCTTNAEDPNEESVLSTQNEEDDDCQVIQKTIINDENIRINEPNHTTNAEDCNEENISLTQTVKHGEMNTDHFISPVIKKDEVTDEENIRGRMNDDAEPRNNIKEKEQCLVAQRLEMERSTDHLKKTEVVENPEEHCKENLNAEAGGMEEKEDCKEERFAAEQCVTMIEDESLTEQDPFLSLLQKLETYSEKDDCIWNVYHKNVDKKTIVFGFISNSLILITTFLSSHLNCSGENPIEKIRIVSRASDNSGVLVRIVHKLILEKLDEEMLMYLYKIHEEVLRMLERVSQDVKLAMDFMFDLKRLDALNLMEIAYNEISFLCRSKRVEIILKVTIKVKRFDKLTSNDISVNCLLGTIKETDVKSLIKNIKKDHKFLRRYMNDIKDYIDIMEETLITKKLPIDLQ